MRLGIWISVLMLAGVAKADILIKNGRLIDGSGAPARVADVLIRGDRIVKIGAVSAEQAADARVIDASDRVVTPGFIDAHTHFNAIKRPDAENFLAMGVTTVCLGQDGAHPEDLPGWFNKVEKAGVAANVMMFVGHGTVRLLSGVGYKRDPNAAQLAKMQQMVREALDLGCFGLTTGLEYLPGIYANIDELVAVAKPVAEVDGLVMSHIRSEDDDQIEQAIEELLEQGRRSGARVHVSHIKVTYGKGTQRAEEVLKLLSAARKRGQQVTADIYPYTASFTGIAIVFPEWAKPPNKYSEVVDNRREELEAYLRKRVALRNGPEATLLGTPPWAGKTLKQVADEAGKPFEDVLIDDIELYGAQAAYFVMDEELQQRLLIDRHVMIGSDGSATARHPRGHGSFARIINKFVNKRQALTLEEAVRKMTGLTAETLRLTRLKRGLLAEGWAADVLVFDPEKVRDTATFQEPHQLAKGFDYVIVNGEIARENGKSTGSRSGRLLRRAGSKLGAKNEMSQDTTGLRAQIETVLADYVQADQPGAAVAVIKDDELIFADGYGLAQLEPKTAIKPDTNFRLASVTKQFTALCIVMLKERGLLSYDDPISRFFPEFPEIGQQITVRHLLRHTSGVVDYEDLIPEEQTEQVKDRDVLTLLKTQEKTYFKPSTKYRYSNSGYALLALIVEKLSGQSFASFLKEHIFTPLEMQDTVAYERGISTVPRRAFGFRAQNGKFVDADQSVTSAVLGDGGIYTSLVDYAKWDAAIYTDKLVSRAALDDIFTPGKLSDGTQTNYGFGWRINQRNGVWVVHHNGSTSGFGTAVRRVPDQKLTLVILTNRADNRVHKLADELIAWLVSHPAALAAR